MAKSNKRQSKFVAFADAEYRLPGGNIFKIKDLMRDLAKHWGVSEDKARERCLVTGVRREVALARNLGSVAGVGKADKRAAAPNRKAK